MDTETDTNNDEMGEVDNNNAREKMKSNVFGMFLMLISLFILQTNMCVVKYSNASLIQMIWYRVGVSFIICATWWFCKRPLSQINEPWYVSKKYRINTWLRGACYNIAILLLWIGYQTIPTGDATCIWLTHPIFISLIGYFYLKDPLSQTYIITVIGCIASLILLSQPSFLFLDDAEPLNVIGIIFILMAVIAYTMASILTRKAKEVHFLQVEVVSTLQGTFFWCPLLYLLQMHNPALLGLTDYLGEEIFSFSLNDWSYHAIGIGVGIGSVVSMLCLIVAYQIGESTKVVFMEYLDILYSYLFQIFLFNDFPNRWELISCASLIIFSFLPLMEEIAIYKIGKRRVYQSVSQETDTTDTESAV